MEPLNAVVVWRYRSAQARADFISAILVAHKSGYSLRAIAEAADLSHQRIGQIVNDESTGDHER